MWASVCLPGQGHVVWCCWVPACLPACLPVCVLAWVVCARTPRNLFFRTCRMARKGLMNMMKATTAPVPGAMCLSTSSCQDMSCSIVGDRQVFY